MLTPLRSPRASKRRVSGILNFPAPVGGWVSDDATNGASVNTARILENLVPTQNMIYVRNGSKTISIVTGAVETLASFDNGVKQELLCAAGPTVYKVPDTSGETNTAGVAVKTGFSNARWQTVMMSNAADEAALVLVNGDDGIWHYDGTAMTEAPASATNKTVSNVINFKGRLWFTKKGSLVLYYGDVLSNKPTTLTPFPIGPILRNGGEIIAINSLSMDGGSGPDDYLVVVTSRGEIVVYSGVDPTDDFKLVGVFKASKPLSKRCLIKSGSDLVFYGSNGPQLLTRLFTQPEGLDALSIAIRSEFENRMYAASPAFGWDLINYPRRSWMLFNVPVQGVNVLDQFVLNLESQSWFRIRGWNGISWATHEGNLFFGTLNGCVILADYGGADDTRAIDFDYMQSWFGFETSSRKKFNMAQVTIQANSVPKIAVDMNVDYKEEPPLSQPGFAPEVKVSPWNVSPWDTSQWSGSDLYYVNSFGLTNIGYVGALRYRGQLKGSSHILHGFRVAFEEGEFL